MQETPSTQTTSDDGVPGVLTRRERRQLMRKRGDSGRTSPWVRRVLIWGGSLLMVVLLGWGMVKLSANTPIPVTDGKLADAVTDRDNILGPSDAPVTLVEYSDFQCPACAAFNAVVKQALADPQLDGKIRFVYRSFPLTNIHPNAQLAARAAQAAALQGKFWEMHDKLFEKQQAWSRLSDAAAREAFKGYAGELGLDVNAFTGAIDSDAVVQLVQEHSDSAERSGVNATPTFFINGSQMARVGSYDEFRQILIEAANANP